MAQLVPGARAGDLPTEFALACLMDGLEDVFMTGESVPGHDDPSAGPIKRALAAAGAIVRSRNTALSWMRHAAEAGYEPAQTELANRPWEPRARTWGEQSVLWIGHLATAGRVSAMRDLGILYILGQGHPTDPVEGVRWLRRAARAGDETAMLWLARSILDGTSGATDRREALIWFRRLADTGDNRGRHYFALALRELAVDEHGLGEGVAMLERARSERDAAAIYELARWYDMGIGVARDPAVATTLLREAAQAGNCHAKLEEMERLVASGEARPLDEHSRSEARRSLDGCALEWRRAENEDRDSGLGFSWVERQQWESRLRAVQQELGRPSIDEAALKVALTSANRGTVDAAISTLTTLAGADEGFSFEHENAIAILAYPAGWLPESVTARFDSQRWRERIAGLNGTDRNWVRYYILSSALTDPNFSVVLSMAKDAAWKSPLVARFEDLRTMGLDPMAYKELLSYLERNPSDEIRSALVDSTKSCNWNRVMSEWVARTAGQSGECGGFPSLRTLDAAQLGKLAELGSGEAVIFLALDALEGRSQARDEAKAIALLEGARAEDVAQSILGVIFEEGLGVDPDPSRAERHYRSAIGAYEQNSETSWFPTEPPSAARYGRMLLEGAGIRQDLRRGLAMVRYGAFNHVAIAETAMGDSLWLGLGQARDRKEALRWYRNAAAHGDPAVLVRFGFLASLGQWNERSLGADRWYELAAAADDPMVYLDLARAAAYAPRTDNAEATVRSWLELAAAKRNRWARRWLQQCRGRRTLACFREQPGFARPFLAMAAAKPSRNGNMRPAAVDLKRAGARLDHEIRSLDLQIGFLMTHGRDPDLLRERLEDRERVQLYHGDVTGAIGSRLRRVLIEDSELQFDHGDLRNYFALVASSCHWGEASKLAYRHQRKDVAVFFAKVAVNRLQAARRYLAGLEGDLKECFVKLHEDRYRWLADLFIEAGRLAEAESVLMMLKDFEYANYISDPSRRGSSRDNLAYSPWEAALAAALDETATALAGARIALPTAAGTAPAPAKSSAATATPLEASPTMRFNLEMAALIEEVAAMDARKPRKPGPTRVDWVSSVQRSIVADLNRYFERDTVALHAVVFNNRIHWIISTAKGQQSLSIPLAPGELDRAIGEFVRAIHLRSPDIRVHARALYNLIFAAVDAELQRRSIKTVLLSLDSRLRYIPFAALHDGNGWLVQRYTFSSFRRPADYLRHGTGGQWTIAGFGATAGGRGLSPLPAVPAELNQIVKTSDPNDQGLLPGIVQIDQAFTRDTLSHALASDFRVIHIASHFVLDEQEAASSYLLLGDGGKLSLLDFTLDGKFTFSHADLVTLSACQTALEAMRGDGSEIDSMGTVAQDAGASSVIASLWSVKDRSTAELMIGLYRKLVTGTSTTAAALRDAQLDMIGRSGHETAESGRFQHPYYWAPFIVLGNSQ